MTGKIDSGTAYGRKRGTTNTALTDVAKGKDPLGVRFDARHALVKTYAGNFLDA